MTKPYYVMAILILGCLCVFGSSGQCTQNEVVYHNLTLDDCTRIALEHNRTLLGARDELKRAYLRVTEARSAGLPQVGTQFKYTRNIKLPEFILSFPDSEDVMRKNRIKIGTENNFESGINLTQPLYVGGKVGTALKAAKIYKELSEKILTTTEQAIIAGTIMSFNSALLAQEMLKVNEESVRLAEGHLENARARYESGAALEYDLIRARVQVKNLQPQLLAAQNHVELSLISLKEILGLDPQVKLTIRGSLTLNDEPLIEDLDQAFDVAFKNRPEITAGQLNVRLMEKALRIARGDRLPTVLASTTFAYAAQSDAIRYDADDWIRVWMADITLYVPLFTGFKTSSLIQQASIDLHKAEIEYQKTKEAIKSEILSSILTWQESKEKIESQKYNLEEAQRGLEMAQELYNSGVITQLDLRDAQFALTLTRTNSIQALFEGIIAETNLRKALGLIEPPS